MVAFKTSDLQLKVTQSLGVKVTLAAVGCVHSEVMTVETQSVVCSCFNQYPGISQCKPVLVFKPER